jgi:calpain-15
LRNPWGSHEWKGDWSDQSDCWTEETKKICNWSDKNDGIFWMPVDEFVKEYENIFINFIHENYFYSSNKIQTKGKKYFQAQFTITEPTNGYISLSQQNKRKIRFFENPDYKYSTCFMYIVELDNNGGIKRYIDSEYKSDKDFFIEINDLEPGNYSVLVWADWN